MSQVLTREVHRRAYVHDASHDLLYPQEVWIARDLHDVAEHCALLIECRGSDESELAAAVEAAQRALAEHDVAAEFSRDDDGMCETACPLDINAGDLVRDLRTAQGAVWPAVWTLASGGWDSFTRAEAAEVRELGSQAHAAANRTCEIGMSRATGQPYVGIVQLLADAVR